MLQGADSLWRHHAPGLVPLWTLFSEWRSRGCRAMMQRLLSVPSILLVVSLVALVAVDSVSFLVKQEDRALFGAFHVLSMLCALCEFIFLILRKRYFSFFVVVAVRSFTICLSRKGAEDMRMNSRVCDLLVVSIVCIYSALAIVDVVGICRLISLSPRRCIPPV